MQKEQKIFAVDCHSKYTPLPTELDLERAYQHREFEKWYETFVRDFTRHAADDVVPKKGWSVYIVDGDFEDVELVEREIYQKRLSGGRALIRTLKNFDVYAGELQKRFLLSGYPTKVDFIEDLHFAIRSIIVRKPGMPLDTYDE